MGLGEEVAEATIQLFEQDNRNVRTRGQVNDALVLLSYF
jgi:hypothetical protein